METTRKSSFLIKDILTLFADNEQTDADHTNLKDEHLNDDQLLSQDDCKHLKVSKGM